MRRLTDSELVELCLNGEREAYSVLIERYQKQVFSLAYRLSGDYDEAQDMAQEVFIHIYGQLSKFDRNLKFFPWMYRIAHNSCINFLARKSRSNVSTFLDGTNEVAMIKADRELGPEAVFEKKEQEMFLYQALRDLPEQFCMPLFLKYIEDLSYNEISEKLGLPVSTIETRLFRGRKLLKKRLAKVLSKES